METGWENGWKRERGKRARKKEGTGERTGVEDKGK